MFLKKRTVKSNESAPEYAAGVFKGAVPSWKRLYFFNRKEMNCDEGFSNQRQSQKKRQYHSVVKTGDDGAKSQGAETRRIDLCSLNYKGCLSCFYCKRKDKSHGICAV